MVYNRHINKRWSWDLDTYNDDDKNHYTISTGSCDMSNGGMYNSRHQWENWTDSEMQGHTESVEGGFVLVMKWVTKILEFQSTGLASFCAKEYYTYSSHNIPVPDHTPYNSTLKICSTFLNG